MTAEYQFTNILVSFLAVSQWAAKGELNRTERIGWTAGVRTPEVELVMTRVGKKTAVFRGRSVPVDVFSLTYKSVELLRFSVYAGQGICFPVRVDFSNVRGDAFTLRTTRVKR